MGQILVADDEPIIRMTLVESLADAGYTVTTAKNGAEALARALELPADMVLLDLLMPDVDGFSFLRERQAHAHLSKVPVIALSAAGIEGLREAWQLRATAVLAKPLNLDVLSVVIEHVLRLWTRESPGSTSSGTEQPIGVCPVCGATIYARVTDSPRDQADPMHAMHAARIRHVLTHSESEIRDVPMRKRVLQLPPGGRGRLASWYCYDLARDWGDQDRHAVHSIDAALDSPALHRLWQDAARCDWPGCSH
jgi:CheY-like chemotaxis protein